MERSHLKAFIESQKLGKLYASWGEKKKSKAILACGQTYTMWVCHECGQYCYLSEFRCGERLCGQCARHRVFRLLESYGHVLSELKSPKLITLSMKSRPRGELKRAGKELLDAFRRLRHSKAWSGVRGAIASFEVTYNVRKELWHPHLHIVVESDFIEFYRLRDAWKACTRGLGTACYIQRCRPGWERELIKYITKVGALLKSPEALKEFASFARSRRFIRTYGSLYNCQVEAESLGRVPVCKGCGAVMFKEKARCRLEEVYGIKPKEFGYYEALQTSLSTYGGARG
jgi:Replication protein